MVMVLQVVDDSFATDYKHYEINLVNKVYNKINHTIIIFRGAYHDNSDYSLILHFWRARLLADRFVNVV